MTGTFATQVPSVMIAEYPQTMFSLRDLQFGQIISKGKVEVGPSLACLIQLLGPLKPKGLLDLAAMAS